MKASIVIKIGKNEYTDSRELTSPEGQQPSLYQLQTHLDQILKELSAQITKDFPK